jgi:YVTN family beta-propeller protein
MTLRTLGAFVLAAALAGCASHPSDTHRLPTGAMLDPAGPSVVLGSMPVAMTFSPDSSRIVVVLSGYREQGIQIVDPATRRVTQTLFQPAAFLGAAFSPDGRSLFVSGGNRDLIYEYSWRENVAALVDSIPLGPAPDSTGGRAYPAGLACSHDGSHLYVAENLADSLAVIDLASKHVIEVRAVGPYPYGVVVASDGRVFVSSWGGSWVSSFTPGAHGLGPARRLPVGRHPSAILLGAGDQRLYATCASVDHVAVYDMDRQVVSEMIADNAPGAPSEGSTPNALALSPDGRRLYVAEADNNAVAVYSAKKENEGALLGRIPVEWYPTAILARGDSLWVLNDKGQGTRPNPKWGQSGRHAKDHTQYTLGQTSGSLTFLRAPADRELETLSKRAATANGWDRPAATAALPPFRHVLYVIRENRTFDQVLGDLTGADGDTSLTFFPRGVTPNAHALADRFGVFDRFFVNAEVSGDGHNWTTAAYASDYVEKTIPSAYSDRGRTYDYDGLNRDKPTTDDVNEPGNGYLWDLARKAGISLRNYGEFTHQAKDGAWRASKPWLAARTDTKYPGWDLAISDTVRAARWISEFQSQVAGDSLPALTILWLPNDHTAGASAGSPTPRAYVASNDLALGRIVEALTRSRYWKDTVVFVLEDDAQDGPDHVDSHRSPLLVISAYSRPGIQHRFANTTDVVATIDRILHLGAMSQFDHFGRPLTEVFGATPDTTAYAALLPAVPLDEVNASHTTAAVLSRQLDLSEEDRANEALFNRILWLAVKGPHRPYPARGRRPGGPVALLPSASQVVSARSQTPLR